MNTYVISIADYSQQELHTDVVQAPDLIEAIRTSEVLALFMSVDEEEAEESEDDVALEDEEQEILSFSSEDLPTDEQELISYLQDEFSEEDWGIEITTVPNA